MPCGLIVFDCYLLVVVLLLVESVATRTISVDRNKRESTTLGDPTTLIERRQSIFDDKNRANLGELHTYLSNYGYLPRSDLETRAMRTDDEFHSAIRRLQTFADVPVTGKIDTATLELIRKPRCGLPDFEPNRLPRPQIYGNRRRRYVLQGQKWAKTYLTYKIMNFTPDMPRESVERAIYHALLIWSYPSQLRFRQATDIEHPDIEFLFAQGYHKDGYQFDGKGAVLAHAFYPEEHLGGDVHYDEDEDWTAYRENEYGLMDLFSVTVHELGHSLGLMHSNIPDAIMFPYYRGYSKSIKLHADDIAAIRKLYGDPPPQVIVPPPSPDEDEIATVNNNQSIAETTKLIETTTPVLLTLETTTITTTTTTTTITTTDSSSPMTLAQIDEAQIQDETTSRSVLSHRHRWMTTAVPTRQWAKTVYQTRTSTRQVTVNFTDPSQLDLCDGFYDAITMYKGILFIFKGQYFWQFDRRGLNPFSPMVNNAFWLGLPETLTKVDAAYERADGRLMLFSGRQYWIFEDNRIAVDPNGWSYPRDLTSLGLPSHVDHIDAAFLWSYNHHAYLVSANLYWSLDERWNRVNTQDYPRDMIMWQGIDIPLDDALVDMTGSTYFFKGLDFWRLNDTSMEAAMDYPRSINTEWLFCDKPRSSSSSFCQSTLFSVLFFLYSSL